MGVEEGVMSLRWQEHIIPTLLQFLGLSLTLGASKDHLWVEEVGVLFSKLSHRTPLEELVLHLLISLPLLIQIGDQLLRMKHLPELCPLLP
jgi:hypothetical protein